MNHSNKFLTCPLSLGILKSFTFVLALLLFFGREEAHSKSNAVTPECRDFLKKLEGKYRYGWIEVPEDYSNVTSKNISVFWYTKISEGQKPVMFFYGGPIWDDRYHYSVFSDLEHKYGLGFIYMDQRGMGCSHRPETINSIETALKASLYSSDNMVRDAEEVRKHLFGVESTWNIFGQSYGGFIVDRYVHMFPQSVSEAFNFAGGTSLDFTEFFYERIKSNLKVSQIFFDSYPGTREQLSHFKSLFSSDVCWDVLPAVQYCGYDLYNELSEHFLSYVTSWNQLLQMLNQPIGCDNCVFKSPGILNPTFMSTFVQDNAWKLNFFFNPDQYVRAHSLWRQEIATTDASGAVDLDCDRALERLSSEGILPESMAYNHCAKVIRAHSPKAKEIFTNFVSHAPVRSVLRFDDLYEALQANPNLKYYAYSAKFDATDRSFSNYIKLALLQNVTHRHFLEVEHNGYLEESQVWKDISGKDLPFFDSTIKFNTMMKTQTIEARAASNGQQFSNLAINSKIVDLGFAESELSEETKNDLKGNVALISRGLVSFQSKVDRAASAGAIAVIIGNNSPFLQKPLVIAINETTQIPVLMISTNDFLHLRNVQSESPEGKFELLVRIQ